MLIGARMDEEMPSTLVLVFAAGLPNPGIAVAPERLDIQIDSTFTRVAGGTLFAMCPRCGSDDFVTTTYGVVIGGQDPNSCECKVCGCKWQGFE